MISKKIFLLHFHHKYVFLITSLSGKLKYLRWTKFENDYVSPNNTQLT